MNTLKQLLQAVAYLFILLAAVITLANLQGCAALEEKTAIFCSTICQPEEGE